MGGVLFPQKVANVKKQLVGLSKELTPVVLVFGQDH
jgi:hypothetical protein